MERINVGIIGTGWCGGIRAETARRQPLRRRSCTSPRTARSVSPRCKNLTNAKTATTDYRQLLENKDIHAIIISATPEDHAFLMARDALLAGKHVFLEKPIAADAAKRSTSSIAIAQAKNLKFTIGYSQRFNPKYAYMREKLLDGTIGEPVSRPDQPPHHARARQEDHRPHASVARPRWKPPTISTSCSGAWSPRKPIRIYSQAVEKVMIKIGANAADHMWIMVTMDDGFTFTVGAGWILPPGYHELFHDLARAGRHRKARCSSTTPTRMSSSTR